ncbi:hypothetical protein FZEAL_10403 [Fusarium zealandicum]|uniref:Uncharacterized protein n=1 Tax=Fusarium zealandicum TaxID=1053134 RepID=A0A8H4U208_9HYPO|nr:hypothetical protein FZEAL_10403 [Fusarium zealandicum]
MKFNSAITMLAVLAPFTNAMDVHVRSSDDLIDVGDLNLFKEIWQAIYSNAGNREGVTISPAPIPTRNKPCHFDDHTDHSVTLAIEGHWDDVGGNRHEYRDAMVEAAWEALKKLSDQRSYNIRTGCCYESISTSCPIPGPGGCSFKDCQCHSATNARCLGLVQGHRVPSIMNVYTTKNGATTANSLRISFRSDTAEEKGGCGMAETAAKGLASFIFPGPVANIVGVGIDLKCA